jgi:class 3 adenylate cyclase
MGGTRKIAAILVADVVGYSRLAGADEDRTLARLRGLRSDLIDPAIDAHHVRIVKRTGDGAIIEFRSVVDAVRCAIEIQNGLIERNAGLPEDRRIQFRVGIHLGDVVEESDGDLMGDGVNIAARLEGIAQPGVICLSEDAYRQVKGRLDLAVSDLGTNQLKTRTSPTRSASIRCRSASPRKRSPRRSAQRWPQIQRKVLPGEQAVFRRFEQGVAWLGWRTWSPPREPAVSIATVNDKLATAPRLSSAAVICNKSISYIQDAPPQVIVWTKCDEQETG